MNDNTNNCNDTDDEPTLTSMFAELYKEEYKQLIAEGFTYINIMWKRIEIIDGHGYRSYKFDKPIQLSSEIGTINAPEYGRLIVKNPQITEDEFYVYIKFNRSTHNKIPGELWAKEVVEVMNDEWSKKNREVNKQVSEWEKGDIDHVK